MRKLWTEVEETDYSSVLTLERILKKTPHETSAQPRVQVATMYPTFVRKYSRYRNSVKTVRLNEIMRNKVLRLKPIFMDYDEGLLHEESS